MKKNRSENNYAFVALIFVTLIVIIAPASAVGMTIDLDKTYKFKLANVSHIDAIDLGDPSVSKVEVLTTAGDSSDVQLIHTPTILYVNRTFTSTTGTFNGVTVTITGDPISTKDYTNDPDFRIYTTRMVPTFRVTAPGQVGNPIVTRYNESWTKEDTGSLSSLFRSSDGAYLYKSTGLININTTDNEFTSSGVFQASDYDKNNITFTLNNNEVALDSFATPQAAAFNMGDAFPYMTADTGKYYAGAISHDEAAQTIHVYAMSPVVVLQAPARIDWTNTSGTYTGGDEPFFYTKGSASDITLDFNGAYPTVTKVTYLFINRTQEYNMTVMVDTARLAEKAETRWQTTFAPSTHIIDLLYDGIANDVNTPFNYTMEATGYDTPAPSTEWSAIAITPGFGISGKADGSSVNVPAATMNQLDQGLYDLYVMGTDADNNIIALDQRMVLVTAAPAGAGDELGVYRPSTHTFYLRPSDWPTTPTRQINWGISTDLPVTGDWS